nr:MAG TPA: hypothetical protein [Caudoviricetes sp.]
MPLLETLIDIYKHLIGKVKVYFSKQEYNKNGFVQVVIFPLVNSDVEAFVLKCNADGITAVTNGELRQELFDTHFYLYKSGVTN